MKGRPPRGRILAVVAAVVLVATSAAFAQRLWSGGPRFGGWNRLPPKFASAADFDGSWMYCRGFYTSSYREPGGSGWNTDYPGADNNFSVRLMELTTVHVPVVSMVTITPMAEQLPDADTVTARRDDAVAATAKLTPTAVLVANVPNVMV